MAKLSPISRNKLIKKLRKLGFEGPFIATLHQYMLKEKQKIFIPNPHGKDIAVLLLRRIIQQLNTTVEEFISL